VGRVSAVNVKQRANEDEYHLVVYFLDIVPDAEDDSAHFSCDRDSVLGVVHAVFLRLSLGDKLPVDDAGLDLVAKADEEA
jgi:hypothetical protein